MENRLSINEYGITITANSSDPALLSLIKEVPEVFATRSRNTYNCSLKYIPEVLRIFRGVTSEDRLKGRTRELYANELQRRRITPLLMKHGPTGTSDTLWEHQSLGVELAQINQRFGFFYDTRTGKTMMALQIMLDTLKAGDARRCLVVCPSSIIQSWLSDAKKYFPELKVVGYYGTPKQKAEALRTPSHIVVWSMEQFVDCLHMIEQISFDICFIDESSKLKSHRTQISKAMLEFSTKVPRWYLLSATPAPNNESEYYTQMRTIDPYIFNPARTHFVNKYFDNMSRNPKWEKLKIKNNMYDEFMNLVKERAIYVDQDVMPTAGKEWHEVRYKLPEETRKIYDTMRKHMWAEISDMEITVDMETAMRAKLSQITSGFIMDTEAIQQNKVSRKLGMEANLPEILPLFEGGDYSRISQLDKLLKDLGDQKVVIWANYRGESAMIQELLGDRARYIRGGCTVGDKEQFIGEFKGGPLQYLVCHPLSVGMGINLTEASAIIYYSLNDSWEQLKQSSERTAGHIKLQPNKCHYYVILAENTVNGIMYANLRNKRSTSYAFTNHLKAEALQ